MDIDQVLHDFSVAEGELPEASMKWALDNWEIAAPRFKLHLDDLANGRIVDPKATNAALFIVHLIGERREASAFATLCAFLKHRELADEALGDAITSTLRNVLIAAFDGEPRRLQDLVECETADEYVRGAALEALAYLSFSGATPGLDMRAYLLELRDRMQPRGTSLVWATWAIEAAHLGYGDFTGEVEELLRQGFIDESVMTLKDFAGDLERTLGDPTRRAGFAFDNVQPFTDTIGELSQWHGFSAKREIAEAKRQPPRVDWDLPPRAAAPASKKQMPKIGRNDPCPCGSGKKYKKCCLAA